MKLSPAIRRMIADGRAQFGPPVRVEIQQLSNSGISVETRADRAIELPLPPSTNNLFMTIGKHRPKSPKYRDWIATAVPMLAALTPLSRPPFALTYTLFGGCGLNLARDLGNIEKPITDAIVAAKLLPDDSLRAGLWSIQLRYVERDEGTACVRVELTEGDTDHDIHTRSTRRVDSTASAVEELP